MKTHFTCTGGVAFIRQKKSRVDCERKRFLGDFGKRRDWSMIGHVISAVIESLMKDFCAEAAWAVSRDQLFVWTEVAADQIRRCSTCTP